jgi:hypothetical protein
LTPKVSAPAPAFSAPSVTALPAAFPITSLPFIETSVTPAP